MNCIQAKRVLENILNEKDVLDDIANSCIFIDGDWGVGKTHFISNYFDENNSKYEFIYISLFGKTSIKDIEKSILIHSLSFLKKVDAEKSGTKLIKTFLNDLGDKFLGVSIDSYINSFSVEDIKWISRDKKKKIICFDDIERKSDDVKMKDLMGLIERVKKSLDLIIIGNLNVLNNEENKNIFKEYSEKVLDYTIKIDKLDRNILDEILFEIKGENRDEIIDIYMSDNISFGKNHPSGKDYHIKNIHNLRFFKKYVKLIMKIEKYLEPNKVDEDVLKVCKAVLYDKYFSKTNTRKEKLSFDKYNIYKAINKIMMNEDVKREKFEDYFIATSEVRRDIKYLYNTYQLNEDELKEKLKKVDEKIEKRDIVYFIKQENVVSVLNTLNDLDKLSKEKICNLYTIIMSLYIPEKDGIHNKIDYLVWNDCDSSGNEFECNTKVKNFIEKINNECKEKYYKYIDEKINIGLDEKNYDSILDFYKFNQIEEIEKFEEIFDYYFKKLVIKYSSEIYTKICTLIHNTNSEIIKDFFTIRIKSENQITSIKKYEMFDEVLGQKMEYESQMDYYRKNPIEIDEE